MQQGSNTQWPSTNPFPTLTHLHIGEITKGTQKLNQILKACSNGSNIDKGTLEIGNELWKGAMELEQSLRMLVSLQKASESMASQKRKSRLTLLEDGEEDNKDNTGSKEKQKQIERPVFSFDKLSKNRKSNAQASLQQNLMALTYLKKTQFQITFHGHSRSDPESPTSQHTHSSEQRQDIQIPNVIAKLMGLEELSHNGKFFQAKNKRHCHNNSSKHKLQISDVTIEYTNEVQGNQNSKQSNKIVTLKCHEPGLQQETFRLTYYCSYRATAHSHKPMRNQEEREAIRNNANESKAAISKINELQSHTTQLDQTRYQEIDKIQQYTEKATKSQGYNRNPTNTNARENSKFKSCRQSTSRKKGELQRSPYIHESLEAHLHPGHETRGKNVK
ncbi:hypothetical protein Cgig2_022001 [Carnegiea gigantea]|uniref:DUF3741 domain-containing protein n=1 Tax=Carnegiea gigantea TaxID=171969 RepID=A0A9Q1KRS4_9CARY|nr:hypothetical protein Cgig2_022001 [Carnegiea gigantea]